MSDNPNVMPDGTWKIPADRFSELSRRVDSLNKRVKKCGHGGLNVEIVREEKETLKVGNTERVYHWSYVKIVGEIPVVDGWQFIARIEHHGELGNIISRAPSAYDIELPNDLQTADPTCDHCGYKRNRKDTFVLLNSENTFKRVGRNCLADFLRGSDPELVLKLWSLLSSIHSLLSEFSNEESFGGGGAWHIGTTSYLAATVSAIRNCGWVSRKAARESGDVKRPTTSDINFIINKCPEGKLAEEWRRLQPEKEDYEEAGEVIVWVQDLAERTDLNEYLNNLRIAVSLGYVEYKHEGLVASAVATYRREMEAKRDQESRPESNWVGEVGKRIELELEVRVVRFIESDYGVRTLLIMNDSNGNDFKWLASGSKDFKIGTKLTGKCTIKEHSLYKERKVTELSRCKLEEVNGNN